MKKRLVVVLISLALMSLACLQSARISTAQAVTMAPTFATQTQTVTPIPTFPLQGEGAAPVELCALVIAEEALNVREGLSVHSQILTWLNSGDVVRVLDQSNADWWRIEHAGVSGYTRSIFLEEKECISDE